jgi:hypothetical protein
MRVLALLLTLLAAPVIRHAEDTPQIPLMYSTALFPQTSTGHHKSNSSGSGYTLGKSLAETVICRKMPS